MDDNKVIEMLVENAELLLGCTDYNFSRDEFVWLTKESWKRSRFKKMVSVKPMLGPTTLVNYIEHINGRCTIKVKDVIAKPFKCGTTVFEKADFNSIKNVYADAIALDIDCFILPNLPRANAKLLVEESSELRKFYDYIVVPENLVDKFENVGVDVYSTPVVLDPDSFEPISAAGKYPTSHLQLPVFCPYLLVAVGPRLIPGNVRSVMLRAGWCTGKEEEKPYGNIKGEETCNAI